MVKKHFVVRTHSLVSKESYKTCLSFGSDNEVDIPFPVIDELEKLTKNYDQKAKNARAVLDYISSFDINKILHEGIMQKNGSILRLVKGYDDIDIPLKNLCYLDKNCLQIAKGLQIDSNGKPVILVTRNPALRIKANTIGIKAQDFRDDIYPTLKDQYLGRACCQTSDVKLNRFFEEGSMPIKSIHDYTSIEWMPNLFLTIKSSSNPSKSAVARYDGERIVSLRHKDYHPFGISAKNIGQLMILESLMEGPETAPLVVIKGSAGTGKTFMTLAVAIDQAYTSKEKVYSQITVSTPVETVGQEKIGFLPGEIEDKFNPHLGGIRDNLRILSSKKDSNGKKQNDLSSYLASGKIQVQPIGFLRGRTIVDTFFIIDETQNISPDDIKSIVSRAGQGSKFVFLGDPTQIDNPQLNERYNGLVYLSEKMKDSNLAWQITLDDEESVRSTLARIAAKTL